MDHRKRLNTFCAHLERAGLPAYWVTDAANVRYLTGFSGHDSTLLATPRRSILLTDSRYLELAQKESATDEVFCRHGPMAQAVAALCKRLGVRRVAVTPASLTQAEYAALSREPGLEPILWERDPALAMRKRKDPEEVEAIRASIKIAEAAFRRVLALLEAGQTERWLAARLEFEMHALGAEGAAFDTICAAGARSSVPHAIAGDAPVGPEEPVLWDWGARLGGYCCDLTRVVCKGRIPPQVAAAVELVLEAQKAALAAIRPGNCCSDADRAGRAVLARAGRGRLFGHGIGHGVGLQVHESPRLGPGADEIFVPGMVVTVEPGIYIPGQFGVRLEQMALVTAAGCEVLTTLPQNPRELCV